MDAEITPRAKHTFLSSAVRELLADFMAYERDVESLTEIYGKDSLDSDTMAAFTVAARALGMSPCGTLEKDGRWQHGLEFLDDRQYRLNLRYDAVRKEFEEQMRTPKRRRRS